MEPTYTVTTVRHRAELEQILALQQKNLKPALDADEMRSQGFVTVQHDLTALERMHAMAPSIVANHGEALVAYALTMPREARALAPVLEPMFALFDTLQFRGTPLNRFRFYVMGQICIDKAHRGQGLFERLYHQHREQFRNQFDLIVTEVSASNPRSLRAHERVGFETLHTYRDATDEWAVVAWNWAARSR
ncbi:Protein export cytoplasm protein SecA ATPase RNA helicase [Myxococcus hansupus]|uniref:Protein export cytoplasm protein SecA ATPase RNA helicase n=1 Tax=Pseudomyxococcus hansupus TaxID=1297742 RepID=A0A0H4WV38_9BACT|nr:GNAT family N-acetyltransferase [Myxococcus hansupus]AKQ67276.1 Protein export cytoplasm protein SecA ATPase RNA helicase [Myxococcus hansupus]